MDRLIDGARGGRAGVMVLRGEPGAGKTSLLDYAIDSASDLNVARAAGVESERALAFAALHQLCAPVLDRLERLPGPQRDAVAVTFGLSEGPVPDRFMVGLGVLSLLSEAAEDRPLLCVVDDAHWLDKASAQGLAFVARRLLAESVVLLFAAREPGEDLRDLPEMVVGGLSDGDARELLASVVPWLLDERVREQIVAETQGNPLALIELTRGLSRAQVAGGFGLQNALPLEGRIEEQFLTRLEALSADSRTLLLLAAAEPTGDPALVWRAAERLGVTDQGPGPVEVNGLLEVGTRVRFRHPLIRSAVYRAASPQERQDAHRALGEATDQLADPDRRAWHLAEAAAGPDEELAAELERSAERARARGGLAAAASFLERAVALTPDRSLRADRALAAAQRSVQAGAVGPVESLLVVAEAGAPSDLQRARADEVRAQLAFVTSRGRDAVPLLVNAAKRLEPIAPEIAQATYLDAVQAAIFAGRLATPGGALRDVARAASAGPARAPTAAGLFLEGLSASFSHGYAAGVPILRRALTAFGDRIPTDEALRGSGPACILAAHLWDDDALEAVSERWVTLCRQAGALGDLPRALNARAHALMFAGDLTGAASLLSEVAAASEATGIQIGAVANMALAALRGDEAEALALIETSVRDAPLRGEGNRLAWAELANAVLNNGLGRHQQALASAECASDDQFDLIVPSSALAELIEAAARTGMTDTTAGALRRLSEIAGATGSQWAMGVEARSRALVSDGEQAEGLYREAIDRLAPTRARVELGRAHLLYGEWLRRKRRRVDAREQLRTARQVFRAMGAEAFADRAERELLATGEHVRKRVVETRDDLTAQEAHIARLAGDGVSNAEIATRLFISRRTVEYHLNKVFTKLGISSRHQLDGVLPPEPTTAAAS